MCRPVQASAFGDPGASHLGEEKPGLLNQILEGLTSLVLRGWTMLCSDIASPTLRCLTVLTLSTRRLPGARAPDSRIYVERKTKPCELNVRLCSCCMQSANVPSCRSCDTALAAQ